MSLPPPPAATQTQVVQPSNPPASTAPPPHVPNSNNSNNNNSSSAGSQNLTAASDQKSDSSKPPAETKAEPTGSATQNANALSTATPTPTSKTDEQIRQDERDKKSTPPPPPPGSTSSTDKGDDKQKPPSANAFRPWHRRSGNTYSYQTDDNKPVEVPPGGTAFLFALRKGDIVVYASLSEVLFGDMDDTIETNWKLAIAISTSGTPSSAKYNVYTIDLASNYVVERHLFSDISNARALKVPLRPDQVPAIQQAFRDFRNTPSGSPRRGKARDRDDETDFVPTGLGGQPPNPKRQKIEHLTDTSTNANTRSGHQFRGGAGLNSPQFHLGRGGTKPRGGGRGTAKGRGRGRGTTAAGQEDAAQTFDAFAGFNPALFGLGGSRSLRTPLGALSSSQVNQKPPVNLQANPGSKTLKGSNIQCPTNVTQQELKNPSNLECEDEPGDDMSASNENLDDKNTLMQVVQQQQQAMLAMQQQMQLMQQTMALSSQGMTKNNLVFPLGQTASLTQQSLQPRNPFELFQGLISTAVEENDSVEADFWKAKCELQQKAHNRQLQSLSKNLGLMNRFLS